MLAIIKGNCPKPEVLYPCKCINKQIDCTALDVGSYDIKFIFQALSNNVKTESDRHFDSFTLSNKLIEEFEDNVFGNITFDNIIIVNSDNFKRISAHAFKSSVDTLESFTEVAISKIGENSNGYEFFKVMSSLNNLNKIQLQLHKIPAIPPNAFNNPKQTKLEAIDFNSHTRLIGAIKSIGNNAFSALTNLKFLNLYGLEIDHIPKHAFDFNVPSNQSLHINLGDNPLNGSSFEMGAFLNAKRPLNLNFFSRGAIKMDYLDGNIFLPFLKSDKRNILSFTREPSGFQFACDCLSHWLVKEKALIKDQVNLNIRCPRNNDFEGKTIWEVDEKLFAHCK